MNIFSLIREIFNPAVKLVDEVHTSEEEKLQHKAATLESYVNALEVALDYESDMFSRQAEIVQKEAESEHWLTSTWRPITMLTFLCLVVCDQFGWLTFRLAPEAWTLLQIGLGGYVVGRSVEKVAPKVISAFKQKDEA